MMRVYFGRLANARQILVLCISNFQSKKTNNCGLWRYKLGEYLFQAFPVYNELMKIYTYSRKIKKNIYIYIYSLTNTFLCISYFQFSIVTAQTRVRYNYTLQLLFWYLLASFLDHRRLKGRSKYKSFLTRTFSKIVPTRNSREQTDCVKIWRISHKTWDLYTHSSASNLWKIHCGENRVLSIRGFCFLAKFIFS